MARDAELVGIAAGLGVSAERTAAAGEQVLERLCRGPGAGVGHLPEGVHARQRLPPEQESDLIAFLDAVSPKQTADLEYTVNYPSMETLLQDPTGGNAANGKKLADKYCMTCHLDGQVGPVWAPGLYEPDWVVRRVRRLEGHQNRQMPNFSQARLPDAELRDIVTYLTEPKSSPPIFKRKKSAGAPATQGRR